MTHKFTKTRKGRNKGKVNNIICFCELGLQAINRGRLLNKQIEAGRKVISRKIKKTGKLIIRIKPNIPITKKPIEVRMGSGKGDIKEYIYKIKPGHIIYEINYINKKEAKQCLIKAGMKLPIKTTIIERIL